LLLIPLTIIPLIYNSVDFFALFLFSCWSAEQAAVHVATAGRHGTSG